MVRIWLNRPSKSAPSRAWAASQAIVARSTAGAGTLPSRDAFRMSLRASGRPVAFKTVNMRCARSMPVADTRTMWHLSSRNSANPRRPAASRSASASRMCRRTSRMRSSAGAAHMRLEKGLLALAQGKADAGTGADGGQQPLAPRLAGLRVEIAQHTEQDGEGGEALQAVHHLAHPARPRRLPGGDAPGRRGRLDEQHGAEEIVTALVGFGLRVEGL